VWNRRLLGSFVVALLAWGLLAIGRGESQPPRQVSIDASGDLLLHIKVVKAAHAHGWERVFEGLAAAQDPRAITYVNLETPLTEEVRPVKSGSPPVLGAPPSAAAGLAAAGVDVVGCANNHSYDQLAHGMSLTVDALEEASLVAVGAGADEDRAFGHRVVERDGVRVAFLSYTERINHGPGSREPRARVAWLRHEERFDAAIAAAREDADLVVLGVHWSHDFVERPLHVQRRKARAWAEAGVDLILGTGPHVLQEVERLPTDRGETIVAYSLGNLVSNQGQRWRPNRRISDAVHPALRLPETRDGALLRTRFTRRGERWVADVRATPLWTANNFFAWAADRRGTEHDIRVRRLADSPAEVQEARWSTIADTLGDEVRVDPRPEVAPSTQGSEDPSR